MFSEALATSKIPVMDAATQFTELGEALLPLINPMMTAKYGMKIASFILENVSLPPEVEEAIDKRSSMAAVGNLNDYVKFQLGKGMETGGGGAGGMATEMAVGLTIAQQMMQQQGSGLFGGAGGASAAQTGGGQLPKLLTPIEVANTIGVPESDVMSIIESGELKAKKIGTSYRIKQEDLKTYLSE